MVEPEAVGLTELEGLYCFLEAPDFTMVMKNDLKNLMEMVFVRRSRE